MILVLTIERVTKDDTKDIQRDSARDAPGSGSVPGTQRHVALVRFSSPGHVSEISSCIIEEIASRTGQHAVTDSAAGVHARRGCSAHIGGILIPSNEYLPILQQLDMYA